MRPLSLRRSCYVWLLAAMAVLGQIVGAASMPDMADEAQAAIICSLGSHPQQPAHHHHDCAVCPYCAAATLHAALLSPAPLLPAPGVILAVLTHIRPPPRAPPARQFAIQYPRGPPTFS